MVNKSQTKLMQLVAKRAAAMREPFRNSPWTDQMSHTNKKPLVVNKSKQISQSKTKSKIKS